MAEKNVKISVVVPVYNVEKYLRECLESLVNQTFKDIEIICVNNGSTDNSLEILEEYAKKDSRIIVINQENRGPSGSRNRGLECVRGEYLAFVDSDDYMDLDFYEKLYKSAKETDADIAATKVKFFKDGEYIEKNIINKHTYRMGKDILETPDDKIYFVRVANLWNKIYKTELINKNNIRFVNGITFEDTHFSFLAIALAKKISIISDTSYIYRLRETSILSRAFYSDYVFDICKIFNKLRNHVAELVESGSLHIDYKKMCDFYMLKVLYEWNNSVVDKYKESFKAAAIDELKSIDVENNKYINAKFRRRYNKLMGIQESFFKKLLIFR